MSQPEAEILFERRGAAGFVTLNRPQALNAVTLIMVRALRGQLDRWRDDPLVTRVVVIGAGERAFSAGGDLRQVYELGRNDRHEEALTYWREEYALNTVIKHYPKPYVALIDGIVMGGGVGVSIHGSHRIAGDKFLFAMPEVNIGFFPDVGATWFLPRLPGELGTYCAVTGERLRAADAVAAGIATHRVASAKFDGLIEGLCGTVPVEALAAGFTAPAEEGALAPRRGIIDRAFAGDSVEAILGNLDHEAQRNSTDSEWCAATAATIRARSPTSLKLALRQVRLGARLSFEECMRTEFRIVSRVVHGHDFYEGVRALIIDKDNTPRWQPASLSDVGEADLDRYFAPLERELELP
jgi:enoyl-CoA hydratase